MKKNIMAKFDIKNPHTVGGEAARAMLASMWNHDLRKGLGGYYMADEDLTKVRAILGDAAEESLQGAGFEQHPHYPRRYWTGARSPFGDDALIRYAPPFHLLRAITKVFAPAS
jgi:hypothetical protein